MFDCYKIPQNIENIWKSKKKRFQIWNAIYYTACKKQWKLFEITPYMLKKPPFYITDIKKASLCKYLDDIIKIDNNISFDKTMYESNEKFYINVREPVSFISIPNMLTENLIFKGRSFTYSTEIPALLFLMLQLSEKNRELINKEEQKQTKLFLDKCHLPTTANKFDPESEIVFDSENLKTYLKKLSGRFVKPVNVMESLKGKKVIEYKRLSNAKENLFIARFTLKSFNEHCHYKKLTFKIGSGLDPTTASNYIKLSKALRHSKSQSSADYLLIADAIGRVIDCNTLKQLKLNNAAQVIEKLNQDINSWNNRGKHSLRNAFKKLMIGVKMPIIWLDVSLSDNVHETEFNAEIPLLTYSHYYLFHYFYPGSKGYQDRNNLRYVITSSLKEKSKDEKYRFSLLNQYLINSNNKILNAYRGPVMCCFPKKVLTSDSLFINIEEISGFKKLNVRILAVLVPEIIKDAV